MEDVSMLPEFFYLHEATTETGRTESFLIRLGINGNLKFYVVPKKWAYVHMNSAHITHHINDLIPINASYLKELETGVNAIMYFSDDFPDCTLVDLDEEVDRNEEADYSSDPFGLPITRDRLAIMTADLMPFLLEAESKVVLDDVELKSENKKSKIYTQREISFQKWQDEKNVDVKPLPVKVIFNQVKMSGGNDNVWNIDFETFKRNFWQPYSKEKGLAKRPGRPSLK